MKLLRYVLPMMALVVGVTASKAYADDCFNPDPFHNPNRQRDFEAVQEFVNSKRTISLEEKDSNLSIAGDVRFDWAHIVERLRGDRLRGKDGTARQVDGVVVNEANIPNSRRTGLPFSTDVFDVQFNLYFDYVCDRAWAVAWLEFDENAGIDHGSHDCTTDPQGMFGSGCCQNLCLRKAYMGYNICADGCSRFDVELGRRPLYTVFDSRIQFQNRFDGLLLKYNRAIECWGDFYWNLGAFIVDERVEHYAYVTELGLLNIYDCGVDVKYSFIDWKSLNRHNRNRCGTFRPIGIDYKVSQFTFAYHFNPEYLCKPTKLYGAILWNSAGKRSVARQTSSSSESSSSSGHNKKRNIAWYVGFIIGQVCHEGDWSLDVNYQVCQAHVVPDGDIGGIGSGGNNLLGSSIATNGVGLGNYKGWRFEGLYALTDNLSIDASLEFSKQDQTQIGGKHSYSKFEISAIYAF